MERPITISGTMTAGINFAMQQNYVPIFRGLTAVNDSDEVIPGVRLRISFEPEFARTYETVPADLRPGQPVEFSPVNIVMNPDYLFGLTEKIV